MSDKPKHKATIIDVLSGDNSREGYAQGFKDGEESKTPTPGNYAHIRPVNFILNFDNAATTYTEAYKAAYTDAQRKNVGLYDDSKCGSGSLNTGSAEPTTSSFTAQGGARVAYVHADTETIATVAANFATVLERLRERHAKLSADFSQLSEKWQDEQGRQFWAWKVDHIDRGVGNIYNLYEQQLIAWLRILEQKIAQLGQH